MGVKHALAATSCTTALHLILAAMGIGPGDEVIVPAFTWVATANVVLYCGATPVLADVDRSTYNIDPADVARRVTPRTKAVIAVHLFGLCADMRATAGGGAARASRSSKTPPVLPVRVIGGCRRQEPWAKRLHFPSIRESRSRPARAGW